jgi:iron complex outermembrane receptor protein
VSNVIDTYGADYVINRCLARGEPQFCGLIHRVNSPGTAADGSLWIGQNGYVVDDTLNLGELRTKGIDLSVDWALDIGDSNRLAFSLTGTYTDAFEKTPVPDDEAYDCVGLYGSVCGTPLPQWRHKFRTTWTLMNNLDVSLTWRHVDEVKLDHTSSNSALAGDVPATDAKLGSRDYFDLSGAYTFLDNYTLRLGVNNLTDRDPPITGQDSLPPTFGNGNTFPQVYDALGRYGFVNLTIDF